MVSAISAVQNRVSSSTGIVWQAVGLPLCRGCEWRYVYLQPLWYNVHSSKGSVQVNVTVTMFTLSCVLVCVCPHSDAVCVSISYMYLEMWTLHPQRVCKI